MLKGPSPHIKFGLPLSKSWLKACYTGNALKPFPFQFDHSSFDRALSNCFLLLSLNFSRFFLVNDIMIESDKIDTHFSVFCDYRFRSIF